MRLFLALALGTASAKRCQVCSASKNQFDEFVDGDEGSSFGNQDCWEGNPKFEEECEFSTDVCKTSFDIKWFARGAYDYSVGRGCVRSENAVPEGLCTNLKAHHKWCDITCDDDGCNNDLDSVLNLFPVGNVDSCYTCEYYQQEDGTFKGQPECLYTGRYNGTQNCPRYANIGCSTTIATHESLNKDNSVAVNARRSCSPFEDRDFDSSSTDPFCQKTGVWLGSVYHEIESCKWICDNNNCNV